LFPILLRAKMHGMSKTLSLSIVILFTLTLSPLASATPPGEPVEVVHVQVASSSAAAPDARPLKEITLLRRDGDASLDAPGGQKTTTKDDSVRPAKPLHRPRYRMPRLGYRLPRLKRTGLPRLGTKLPRLKHSLPRLKHELPRLGHSLPRLRHRLPRLGHNLPRLGHSLPRLKRSSPRRIGRNLPRLGRRLPRL
jgi:hypothetical protein